MRFLCEVRQPSTVRGYYQPLAMISLMGDCALGARPDNLRPIRRTSLALHVFNTALVVVLLHLLFGHVGLAGAVGLMFGVHPMMVESVTWLSDRKTVLATFFALWSLIAYVRYTRTCGWGPYVGSVIAYCLALLSKPTAIPLPCLMLLLDFWPLRRLGRRALLEKTPLLILGGMSAAITFISQTLPGRSLQIRVTHLPPPLQVCHNVVFYIHKMFWPSGLSPHYGIPHPPNLSHPAVLAGVVGTCVLIVLLLISLRWWRAPITGWLFFFVAIFPTLGVVTFTDVVAADRFVYLPMVGLLLVVCWVLGRMWTATVVSFWPRVVVVAAIAGVLVSESLVTRHYLAYWQNSELLHRRMVTLAPHSPETHYNLGLVLSEIDQIKQAMQSYRKAVELRPHYGPAHNNLGRLLRSVGQTEEAIFHYKKALRASPRDYRAHTNLADALCEQDQLEKAIQHLQTALQIRSDYALAHANLAAVLLEVGRIEEAIDHCRTVVRLAPNENRPQFNLGLALARAGRYEEALTHYNMALELGADFAPAYYRRGLALEKLGRLEEAIETYRRTLELKPDHRAARTKLGATGLQRDGP